MHNIRCANCKQSHATVAEVKQCFAKKYQPKKVDVPREAIAKLQEPMPESIKKKVAEGIAQSRNSQIKTVVIDTGKGQVASVTITPIENNGEKESDESPDFAFAGNAFNAEAEKPELITSRQKNYLQNLLETRVGPVGIVDSLDELTKNEASSLIQTMLAQPEKPKEIKLDNTTMNGGYQGIPAEIPDARYCFFDDNGDPKFYRIASNKNSGKRAIRKVLGAPGNFRYVAINSTEANNAIKEILADIETAAIQFGLQVGACGICGSPLTDPESIKLGIGPICLKKIGW